MTVRACPYNQCDCSSLSECAANDDIPSILERQLQKSVELTKRSVDQPRQAEDDDTLKRLKKLLADTKEMVVRAEALVASLRSPRDYYRG